MLFNSISFFIFFPLVVCLYYLTAHRWRPLLLLFVSCYFYMAFVPQYILILLFLITMDYFLARSMESKVGGARKALLVASIVANLGMLFFFKYFNFFNENIAALADLLHWNYSPFLLSIVLPLGLSFHIFQSLSYVIEVYRGKYQAETSYINYALYVMFFPQLVAGPIERPQHLLPQFKLEHRFDSAGVRRGLERMLWGFVKKIVIADNLATYVNQAYLNPQDYSGQILIVATVFFAFQVYCDFSGYSDIAVGAARVLGYDLTMNFRNPFLSISMPEFWRRWHISLSNWLRDYLYYPLALAAKGNAHLRVYWALFVTFVLIGLWHGANWTFVAFGALHGFYLVSSQMTKRWRETMARWIGIARWPNIQRAWRTLITFAMACAGFVFFRADSLSDARYIFANIPSGIMNAWQMFLATIGQMSFAPVAAFLNSLVLDGDGRRHFTFLCVLVLFIIVAEIIDYRDKFIPEIQIGRSWRRWALYGVAVLFIMNLGVTHEIPFIYFQF